MLTRDVGVLLQVADMGAVGVGRRHRPAQRAVGQQHRAIADIGIFGDAALEARLAVFVAQFADQVEPRHLAKVRAAARTASHAKGLLADFGDQADDDRVSKRKADEFSDGGLLDRPRAQFDARLRAIDGRHASDRIGRRRRTRALSGSKIHDRPCRNRSSCQAPRDTALADNVSRRRCCSVNAAYIRRPGTVYA